MTTSNQTPSECPGCGSHPSDRTGNGYDTDLIPCPHCLQWKCPMCDMGDDCECPSCGSED